MYKKLSGKEWEAARRAIQRIALQEGKPVEEVRKEMKLAMRCGLLSDEPQVRAMWQSIPCEGKFPEPEELIIWVEKRTAAKPL